jgi:methionine--tRNA ligase beta chain
MPEISFKEFQNLDLRVGKIISVEEIPKAKNLLKLVVDFGTEQRQAVAGIKSYYKPEDIIGKKYAFILNLERKTMMGIESQCMILAAEDSKGNVVLIAPEKDVEEGSRIR